MDTLEVFVLSEALDLADGDQELFLTLAYLFMQESPKEVASARAALVRQDCHGLAAAAHKLKGSVLPMCAPRLFERAQLLEMLGRQGDCAEAASVCADVERCLAEVHAALRDVIAGGFPS